jgi:holin-like protein
MVSAVLQRSRRNVIRKQSLSNPEVFIMKYIRQFAIILFVSFLGEVLHALLPLPIPASIYGLVLMLAALMLGIVPLHAVRESGKFLIEIMPLMFIPAAVGLTQSWDRLAPILVKLVIITVVSTVLVMAVSGRVTQAVLRRTKRREAQK